jgi:uncharacterized protein YjiS (DUF1127 family)
MLTILTRTALLWMEDQRRRAAVRNLLTRDDRTLEDIGLRRPELEHALGLPTGADIIGEARRRSRQAILLDRRA